MCLAGCVNFPQGLDFGPFQALSPYLLVARVVGILNSRSRFGTSHDVLTLRIFVNEPFPPQVSYSILNPCIRESSMILGCVRSSAVRRDSSVVDQL